MKLGEVWTEKREMREGVGSDRQKMDKLEYGKSRGVE